MGSETFINWAKQLLERGRINVYIRFSGRYPVGMHQYRSILLTESPDRVMSYDLFVERTIGRGESGFQYWCYQYSYSCLYFWRST